MSSFRLTQHASEIEMFVFDRVSASCKTGGVSGPNLLFPCTSVICNEALLHGRTWRADDWRNRYFGGCRSNRWIVKNVTILDKNFYPIDGLLVMTNRVPHPFCWTLMSKSTYTALAAMTTTGPRAGSIATIFPSVLARSLAKIKFDP